MIRSEDGRVEKDVVNLRKHSDLRRVDDDVPPGYAVPDGRVRHLPYRAHAGEVGVEVLPEILHMRGTLVATERENRPDALARQRACDCGRGSTGSEKNVFQVRNVKAHLVGERPHEPFSVGVVPGFLAVRVDGDRVDDFRGARRLRQRVEVFRYLRLEGHGHVCACDMECAHVLHDGFKTVFRDFVRRIEAIHPELPENVVVHPRRRREAERIAEKRKKPRCDARYENR